MYVCIYAWKKCKNKSKTLPLIAPLTHHTATARLTQHPSAITPPRTQRAHHHRIPATSTAQRKHTTTTSPHTPDQTGLSHHTSPHPTPPPKTVFD